MNVNVNVFWSQELQRKQRQEVGKLVGEELQQYKIKGSEVDWVQALGTKTKANSLISVKRYALINNT